MTATRMPERLRPTSDPEWASRGACRDVDPESLFVVGAAQHKAKAICMGCPVRIDCLADALDSRAEFGVWGGMTERERRTLLRRRPDIDSWRTFLMAAQRSEHAVNIANLPRSRRVVR
ncbi:MAG: WhiB family transcriptional regulator [Jatrophihabitantaceae bacterium]